VAPGRGKVSDIALFAVFVFLEFALQDRTTYASDFARADNLWFPLRGFQADFDPLRRRKFGLLGQNMLPEADDFSFTTHRSLFLYPEFSSYTYPYTVNP
jgi:hypothetical protein